MDTVVIIVLQAISVLIKTITLPIDYIISTFLPDLPEELISNFFNYVSNFIAWVSSFIPFSSTLWSFLVLGITARVMIPLTSNAIKLTVRWWGVLH